MVCASPRSALADGPTDAARAKELFERGRDLRAQGNCIGALPLFQRAYALYPPGLGSARNIAVCQETLGHVASARLAWLEVRHAVTGSTDPKYAGWTEDADREVARLAPRVATLTIDLVVLDSTGGPSHEPRAGDGVSVMLDGQPLAKERLGMVIEHDPGAVAVRAAGAGIVVPDEQSLVLGAGESRHVVLHVTFGPAPSPLKPESEPPSPSPESEHAVSSSSSSSSSSSPLRTGAWIALGVGATGLAGAAVSFAVRQSALGALGSSCPNYASAPCNPSSQAAVTSDVNRGRTATTTLNVLGVVGLASSGASIALFAISRSPSGSVAVILAPTGVGAAGTF